MEIRGVQLGHQLGALRLLPLVGPLLESGGFRQRQHVVGRAGQLQHAVADPSLQRLALIPPAALFIFIRREDRKLFDDEEIERNVSDLDFAMNPADNLPSELRTGQ